ncbi:MAG: alpha/beta fold hydrolase [Burkholderiaceae bacterium]
MNLAVVDAETREAKLLTSIDDFDVIDVHWVGNERLVFSLGRLNSPTGPEFQDGGGMFMVGRDGKEIRKLLPTWRERLNNHQIAYRSLEYLASVEGSDEEIIADEYEAPGNRHVVRLNVRTGRKTVLSEGRPPLVDRWVLDRARVPRVAVSRVKDSTDQIVWYRASADAAWQELYRQPRTGELIEPLAFDDDDQTLIVASNRGRDTMAIFVYDPKTRQLGERLAAHGRFDIGADQMRSRIAGPILEPKSRRLIGFTVHTEKFDTVWLEDDYARIQAMIDAALPGAINRFSGDPKSKRLLVSSYSDRQPRRWFFLQTDKRALEPLFDSAPWFKSGDLAAMEPFFYKSRDGLEMLGYLMLPPGAKKGDRLPTVVHIHGGPHVRADAWGFDTFGSREGQLLASRGYAVVIPNFRITPGFGSKIFEAGMRQMGKAMQEDIEDATDWAVAQGVADPNRICLSGASYGGYAALMGVAKTPDKYRCAIAGLAVTDIELLLTSSYGDIPRTSSGGLQFWFELVGNPGNPKDAEAMRAVSPAYLAGRIKAPVFMYSGVDDIRVPIEQPKKMRQALEAQNKPVRWIQKNDEGHGFGKLENNVDLYTQMLEFLKQHIGADGAGK